jgi:hypothetical protein
MSIPTFTLDTNCLIAIDEARPETYAVRALVDAHAAGAAHVAVVAIAASERQRSGGYMENFGDFQRRLAVLGIEHIGILQPMFYSDITY